MSLGGPELKLPKLVIKAIWEKYDMLANQIHSNIWQMLVKIQKSNICYFLTLLLGSGSLAIDKKT